MWPRRIAARILAKWHARILPHGIRIVSADKLNELMENAKHLHLSGVGRPRWLATHSIDIAVVSLRPLVTDATPIRSYRCQATVVLKGGKSFWFPVDIPPYDFYVMRRPSQREIFNLMEAAGNAATTFIPVEESNPDE